MSSGNHSGQPWSSSSSSALTRNVNIVTPQQYAFNQAQLNQAKALLADYQANNEAGYGAYLQLQKSVDDGERAKQALKAIQSSRPNRSSQAMVPPNLLTGTAASYQPFGGQSDYMQSTASIEEVTTPSVASAMPANVSRNSNVVTTMGGELNVWPSFSGERRSQQLNDSQQYQSLSDARQTANQEQWWYGHHQQQSQDESLRLHHYPAPAISATPALNHRQQHGPEQNHAQPVGGSIHASYAGLSNTSSLYGALGQSSLSTLKHTVDSTSNSVIPPAPTVTKTTAPKEESSSARFQSSVQTLTTSTPALGSAAASSSAVIPSSSRPPPPVKASQNTIPTQAVGHGANRTGKSSQVTNAQYLRIIQDWSQKTPRKTSIPIPFSNLWVFKDENGKVDIVCMAEPRSITPVQPSIRPFIYVDLTGNFQYFDKPPSPPLHYYPPKPQQPPSRQELPQIKQEPPQYAPYFQMVDGGDNVQKAYRPPPPPQPRPTARATESIPSAVAGPSTPVPYKPRGPRTPAQAHKEFLARDILRSLGLSSAFESRKRPRGDESDAESFKEGGSKKQAVEETDKGASMPDAGGDLPVTESSVAPVDQSNVLETEPTPNAAEEGTTRGLPTLNIGGEEQVSVISPPVQPLSNPLHVKSPEAVPSFIPPSQTPYTPSIPHTLPRTSQLCLALSRSIPMHGSGPEVIAEARSKSSTGISNRRATSPPITPSTSPPIHPTQSAPGPSKVPTSLPSSSRSSARPSVNANGTNDDVIVLDSVSPVMETISGDQGLPKPSMAAPLHQSKATGGTRRPQVYVLMPPLPEWARRSKHKGKTRVEDEISGGESRSAEDVDITVEKSGVHDAVERKAVELSRSRLREQVCRWKDCEAVLNSTETLSKHVVKHAQDDGLSGMYCMWRHCVGRGFSDAGMLTRHLQNHAQASLSCAYRHCDERFRHPRELVKHHVSDHSDDSLLRPSASPFKPVSLSPGRVPKILPSYQVEARSVRQTAISQDRHAILGPWVLRNICGPIDLGSRRHGVAAPQGVGFYEYDFLASKSNKTSRLEDLDSAAVSRLVHSGLIFWSPEDAAPQNEFFSSPAADRRTSADPVQEQDGPQFHGSEATLAPLSRGESEKREGLTPSEEEEVVELMLRT